MHRQHDGFVQHASKTARESALLATCFWCTELHRSTLALSVCPRCAERYRVRSFPMGLLGMNGPYALTHDAIDEALLRTSPGNYALGYMDGATFLVFYVGRSDADVKRRLHDWVGASSRYQRYASRAKAPCGSRLRGFSPLEAPAFDHVGMDVDSSYTRFAYSYTPSADAAFAEECRNYHDFGAVAGLDNEIHPVPMRGSSAECPAQHR